MDKELGELARSETNCGPVVTLLEEMPVMGELDIVMVPRNYVTSFEHRFNHSDAHSWEMIDESRHWFDHYLRAMRIHGALTRRAKLCEYYDSPGRTDYLLGERGP